jgi:transposase
MLPRADTEMSNEFLRYIRQVYEGYYVVVIWDGAGWHRSGGLEVPRDMGFIEYPSYSPELNPVERLIEELRESTANKVFGSIDEVEEVLIKAFREYINEREKVKSLCGYDWFVQQVEEIINA